MLNQSCYFEWEINRTWKWITENRTATRDIDIEDI